MKQSLIVPALLAISLAACGNNEDANVSPAEQAATPAATPAPAAPTDAPVDATDASTAAPAEEKPQTQQ
jgi:uncharacterized lipoprotein